MKKSTILLAVLVVFTTGCSINHPVVKDYDAHLAKYGSERTLPETEFQADYLIDGETWRHSYSFRAVTVGYAHVWIVDFGRILDKTLQADYVQSAFERLEKSEGNLENPSNLVEFSLMSFEFKDYRAYTTLNINIKKGGDVVFDKTYTSEGPSQGGQMWMAGSFGMKNATLKSTKQSIDDILEQFINDLNAGQIVEN